MRPGRVRFALLAAACLWLSLACAQLAGSRPETAPPAAQTPAVPPRQGKPLRLAGYYTSWSIYAREYPPARIPAGLLSHVIYAFVDLSDEGECTHSDPRADETNIPALIQLRSAHPHLKLLFSIGGPGTAEKFSQAAGSEESRQRLARSCAQFMRENGFDGIDVDWEFPGPQDRENVTALLRALRAALDDGSGPAKSLLTMATGASPYQYNDLALSGDGSIFPWLDWINVMAYNFKGPWSEHTGFNAPLYAASGDPSPSEVERLTFNADAAVQAYLTAGAPAEKIVLGVPFYGRGWQGVGEANQGLYQLHTGAAPGTWGGGDGSYDYADLEENYLGSQDFARHWQAEAAVPWLYSPSRGIFISYDDPQSLAEKAAYVRRQALGGIVIWQLAAGDADGALVDSLFDALYRQPR